MQRVPSPTVNEHLTIHTTLRCLTRVQPGWFWLGVVQVKLVVDGQAQLVRSLRYHAFLGFRTVWDARVGWKILGP